MSDKQDPNQEQKSGASILGDLLNGAEERQETEPGAFDDLEGFPDIDDGLLEEPEPEQVKPEALASAKSEEAPEQAEQDGQKGADIIDMATRKATATTKPDEPSLLTTDVKEDAAMLRGMSANAPLITGKDASLVQFNGKTGRIEPVDSDAAAYLSTLGTNADLYVSRPPSAQQTPMTYNSETFGLETNPTKKPRDFPKPEEAREGLASIMKPTTAEDRLKRASGQDQEANKDKKKLPGHEDTDQQKKNQEQPPQLTPGAMLLRSVGQGIGSIFSAIKQFLEWCGRKIGAIAKRAEEVISKPFSGLKSKPETEHRQVDAQSYMAPGMSATQRAGSAQEAGANLKQQVEARKQNLHSQAMSTTQGYRQGMESQVKTIGEALGVHKAGSTLIRGKDDYEHRLTESTPNDKARVASAQKAIAEKSEHFRDQLESVIQHRDMKLIPMADREDILNSMQQSVTQPMKLTKMEQAALEHGTNPYLKNGKNTAETIQDALRQANTSIKDTSEQLKSQQAIEGVRQAQQTQSEKPEKSFYNDFRQSSH